MYPDYHFPEQYFIEIPVGDVDGVFVSWEVANKEFWKATELISEHTSDIGYSDRIFLYDNIQYYDNACRILEQNNINFKKGIY